MSWFSLDNVFGGGDIGKGLGAGLMTYGMGSMMGVPNAGMMGLFSGLGAMNQPNLPKPPENALAGMTPEQLMQMFAGAGGGGGGGYMFIPEFQALANKASWRAVQKKGKKASKKYMKGAKKDIADAIEDFSEDQYANITQRGLETSPAFQTQAQSDIMNERADQMRAARNQAFQIKQSVQNQYLNSLMNRANILGMGLKSTGGGGGGGFGMLDAYQMANGLAQDQYQQQLDAFKMQNSVGNNWMANLGNMMSMGNMANQYKGM